MKNKIIALIVAILVALSFYNVASAHHPVIVGTPTRECGAESPWNATFTATSDQDWNKDWRSQYKLDSGTLSAWSSWVDDQVPFGPVAIGPFPASKASVVVTVYSQWATGANHNQNTASDNRSVTINRPATVTCPTTTTSSTTTTTTTTTIPPTTSSTTTTVTTTTSAPTTTSTTTTVPVTSAPTTTVPGTTVPDTTVPPTTPTTVAPTTTTFQTDIPPTTALSPEQRNNYLPSTGTTTDRIGGLALLALSIGILLVCATRRPIKN